MLTAPVLLLPQTSPRGFAFLPYEDHRSTMLVVESLSNARMAGYLITVNSVDKRTRGVPLRCPPLAETSAHEVT